MIYYLLTNFISPEAVKDAREANLNEITEVQRQLQETKDAINDLKRQLEEIHDNDTTLK